MNNPRHAGQGAGSGRYGDAGWVGTSEQEGSAADSSQESASWDNSGRVIGRARAPQPAAPPGRDDAQDNAPTHMAEESSTEVADQTSSAIYVGATAAAATRAGQGATGENIAESETVEELAASPFGAELAALRADLDERTGDVQRISAEYANYRKRIDRDRALVVEQATGHVLAALLPVLDDVDRAREHGDLVGTFGVVAEQMYTVLTKFGLTPFGVRGDPFDPTRHEAVSHSTSPEVTEPTCVDVMRRGYLLGERLLRPALVAVADPE